MVALSECEKVLASRVKAVLLPAFDREHIDPHQREQISAVLDGRERKAHMDWRIVGDLFKAGLLDPFTSTRSQLDAPGWKPSESGSSDMSMRCTSYLIKLPREERTEQVIPTLELSAEKQGWGRGRDFRNWILTREAN